MNVYEIVKENLIAKIEAQINAPKDERTIWYKPWSIVNMPCNHISTRPYHGINAFMLGGVGSEFLTFKQLKSLQEKDSCIQLRAKSKGHMVVFFKWLDGKETDSETGEEKESKIPMLRYYKVFNVSDVDGLELKTASTYEHTAEERESQLNDVLFNYLHREGIQTNFTDTGRAFYRPSTDSIDIPKEKYFKHYNRFLDTLAHEVAHSTGKRLGRKAHQTKGDEAYSYEELVAEFAASLLLARYGIASEVTEEQSAAYIASWFNNIKNCPAKLLFNAFTAAEKAANYIMGDNDEEMEDAI